MHLLYHANNFWKAPWKKDIPGIRISSWQRFYLYSDKWLGNPDKIEEYWNYNYLCFKGQGYWVSLFIFLFEFNQLKPLKFGSNFEMLLHLVKNNWKNMTLTQNNIFNYISFSDFSCLVIRIPWLCWCWGTHGVMVIIIENKHGYQSSNLEQGFLHFIQHKYPWQRYESNYSPFS